MIFLNLNVFQGSFVEIKKQLSYLFYFMLRILVLLRVDCLCILLDMKGKF